MEEWKKYKLGTLITLKYGKDHKHLLNGIIPIYGSGGIMRYGEKAIYHGPSILIPRKGSLNNIFYVDSPFWTVDTMFWSVVNEGVVLTHFLYYALCRYKFAELNVGSAVPSLTIPILNAIEVNIPNITTQKKYLPILEAIDKKIELNILINDNLTYRYIIIVILIPETQEYALAA